MEMEAGEIPVGIDTAEAERIARIARKAEEKAAARAHAVEGLVQQVPKGLPKSIQARVDEKNEEQRIASSKKIQFLSKAEREKLALERLQKKHEEVKQKRQEASVDRNRFFDERKRRREEEEQAERERRRQNRERDRSGGGNKDPFMENEQKLLQDIKDEYLGKKVKKKKVVKASEKFAKNYQFEWDADEDTSAELNPIYAKRANVNLLFGRGYQAGVDMREQRKNNCFLERLTEKRLAEQRDADRKNTHLTREEVSRREEARGREMNLMKERETQFLSDLAVQEVSRMGKHWSEKTLEEMAERDWRIFREDFDIYIRGGLAPHPIRNWAEANLPEGVMEAIKEMKFERPSPIQMQAIPVGLQRRDIIGIAETGSGKTAAFIIPVISYIYQLPSTMLARTNEEGPLAIVMAPTRELALQIEQETIKLAKFTKVGSTERQVLTCAVVGGQSIEDQAFKLREGVDIVVGTPGRMNDCLENRYMVLNQCNYVVLDEADRMIDMGFEPQVVSVLEAMGGLLKSENEAEMEQQIQLSVSGQDFRYRVTTMFSATMPTEVERLANTFLRRPAIIKIGDQDSGKNKRIDQQVLFINPAKKKIKLSELSREILKAKDVKVIVFVNLKKQCDAVARFLSSEGFRPTVLHGGKTQDQREDSLKGFREGFYDMLVATDVAGRGLDIPDVTHVINYDLPSKIENYCHRIGRTGRAGKEGIAISLLTDADEEIMYDLKQFLISTDMPVPSQLASHPSAKAAPGTRDEKGRLVSGGRKETKKFAK